jgi:hypothetical protein
MYATTSFSVYVTALGVTDTLQTGDLRDSASAVVAQVPGLFTATPPSAAQVTGVQSVYLADYPAGPDGGL